VTAEGGILRGYSLAEGVHVDLGVQGAEGVRHDPVEKVCVRRTSSSPIAHLTSDDLGTRC
jgi:hypothetical protein